MPIGTMFGGQASEEGGPIGTLFGGQASDDSTAGSGNPEMIQKIVSKVGESKLTPKPIKKVAQKVSKIMAKVFFYGGETVKEINEKFPVKIIGGGMEQAKFKDEKSFYKNVHIPRKNV